jgi:hypothetical protein
MAMSKIKIINLLKNELSFLSAIWNRNTKPKGLNRDWNQLPTNTTSADTIEGFRAALKSSTGRK